MSALTFAGLYAEAYDALYREKDYAGECRVVRRLFEEFGHSRVESVLDLGCGTGSHAALLAAAGFDVVGVDQSGAMVERARAKAPGLEFHRSDLRSLDLGRRFDAAVLMYAVLSYLTGADDTLKALAATRRHLREGGLLFFDAWYGPAVLRSPPSERLVAVKLEDGSRLLRSTTPKLNGNVCRLRYELLRIAADRVIETRVEEHAMRFFFAPELELLLGASGFTPLRLSAFPDIDQPPDESCWYIAVIARAT